MLSDWLVMLKNSARSLEVAVPYPAAPLCWNTVHTLNIPRDRGLRVKRSTRLWIAVMVPFSKARELPKGEDSIRNLESFQVRQRPRSRFSCWYAVRLDVSLAFCVCLQLFRLSVTVCV